MSFNRRLIIALISGFLLGAFWLIALRFVTFQDKRVHHHANFALYINGQRDEFKSTTFYEETSACSADEIGPRTRVHLHDQKSSVVHVHDEGATWGHLFANLGYSLSNKSVQTDKGIFIADDKSSLTFLLNGQRVESIANETIRSEDALVISYTSPEYEQSDLAIVQAPEDFAQDKYKELQKDAAEYNQKNDPSACSGSKPITFGERLRKSVGIGE